MIFAAAHRPAAAAAADDSTYDCLIEPYVLSRVASPVEGVIERFDVDRGDVVHKGQVVARLESGVERANLDLAKAKAANGFGLQSLQARLEFLRRKQARYQKLRATASASEASADEADADAQMADSSVREAEATLRAAELERRRAEVLLEQREIRSPVDGLVVERVLAPGEYQHTQSHILTIAQMNPLRVEAFLPVSAFGSIEVGTRATVRPEEPVGGTYEAAITVVDRVIDAASGSFGVRAELPNPDYALPAGLKCRIRFGSGTLAEDHRPGTGGSPAKGGS